MQKKELHVYNTDTNEMLVGIAAEAFLETKELELNNSNLNIFANITAESFTPPTSLFSFVSFMEEWYWVLSQSVNFKGTFNKQACEKWWKNRGNHKYSPRAQNMRQSAILLCEGLIPLLPRTNSYDKKELENIINEWFIG